MCALIFFSRALMREEAVTVRELAGLLGVHQNTVYAKAGGEIPGFRVGRSWRFFPSEVRAALAASADPFVRRRR